jgi:hypothetical protein
MVIMHGVLESFFFAAILARQLEAEHYWDLSFAYIYTPACKRNIAS